jgi:hypothetical protein
MYYKRLAKSLMVSSRCYGITKFVVTFCHKRDVITRSSSVTFIFPIIVLGLRLGYSLEFVNQVPPS